MNFYFPYVWTWNEVAARLAREPAGSKIRIEKHLAEHPKDGGLRPGIGLPVGQQSDFRLTLPDCRGLHVQDFGTHYEAHIDQTDPACDAVKHVMQDAPGTFVVGAALIGGLLGLAFGRSGEAFAAGLLIGAGAGGISAAAAQNRQGEPKPLLPGTIATR